MTLAVVLPLLLGFRGCISGGGVSRGGVSGVGVRLSSELSMALVTPGNAVAFGGCILAFGHSITAFGLGGSSSLSES